MYISGKKFPYIIYYLDCHCHKYNHYRFKQVKKRFLTCNQCNADISVIICHRNRMQQILLVNYLQILNKIWEIREDQIVFHRLRHIPHDCEEVPLISRLVPFFIKRKKNENDSRTNKNINNNVVKVIYPLEKLFAKAWLVSAIWMTAIPKSGKFLPILYPSRKLLL